MWFVVCSIIQKGIAFITTPIFTRILSKDEYGVVSVYNSWQSIITIPATMMLATGVFNKAMIKFEDDRDGYASSTLFLSTCITLVWAAVYYLFSDFWNNLLDMTTQLMTLMLIDIIFVEAMSFWTIRQRFDYKYKSVVIFTILANILGTLLSLILVQSTDSNKAEYRILGTVIIHVLVYSITYVVIMLRGRRIYKPAYWKYALWYNMPLIPHYLSLIVLNQSDRIMIGRICGNDYSAIYTVAYQISLVLNIITNSIHASFSPWAYQNMKKGEYKSIGRLTFSILIGFAVACFFFSLFSPEIIMVLGGNSYYEAVWIVPPVTMSIVFNVLYSLISNIAFYYEKTKFVMVGTIFVGVTNVALNAIFIPIYGFVAAGYTTLVSYILYSAVHYLFMLKICRTENIVNPYNNIGIWTVCSISVILSIVSTYLYEHTILRYSFIILIMLLSILGRNKIVAILKSMRKK